MARRTAGSAALVLVDGAIELHPEPALFEAMIEGWRRQHSARRLSPAITVARVRVLRRFQAFSGAWPWQWRAEQLEAWVAQGEWTHSTVRGYQGSVALFLDFVCDPRYGWREACMERVGEVPTQICHEGNTATHVADYEGRPGRRPLTRAELQALFDVADEAVADIARAGRKGWLAAFRDATLFKVVYAWGLRRREAAMLDVGDFSANPAAPELGRLGTCHVRYGKAMKGSPPRRRQVATVMPWAAEVLEQYLCDLRPRYGPAARGPELWLTERGGRISPRRIDERFASYRVAAGLPAELSVHSLRHSYVPGRPGRAPLRLLPPGEPIPAVQAGSSRPTRPGSIAALPPAGRRPPAAHRLPADQAGLHCGVEEGTDNGNERWTPPGRPGRAPLRHFDRWERPRTRRSSSRPTRPGSIAAAR